MSNRSKIWLPIILALVLIFGIQIGGMLQSSSLKPSLFTKSNNNDLQEVLNYIQAKYVDTVNTDKLMQATIEDLLAKLDPHSVFIPANRLSDVNRELDGNFEGIGVEFFVINDTITVVNVIAGGPSERAGLLKGDKIVTINDEAATGKKWDNEEVIKKLKGKKDTQVKLGIKRKGTAELKHFTITRGTIPFNSIMASFMLTKDVGYIKLDRFSSTTFTEFTSALDKLKKQGMSKLIFDLRDNGGGILQEATGILDEFVEKDHLLVYTQGRVYQKKEYTALKDGRFETGSICVLINEGSASASEIVAGALQDLDRATIIGHRSFGKGLVQEQYDLPDGAALRLTIAKYYTPSGRCIQRSYSNGIEKYYDDAYRRFYHSDLNVDTLNADTTKYYTTSGRVVYGGGGITPDIFVGTDTSYRSVLLSRLESNGDIQEFAYQYTFDNNNPDVATIDQGKLAVDFSRFLIKKGMTWSDEDWKKSSAHISKRIIAFIVKEESGDNMYYKYAATSDLAIQKALEQLMK